MTYAQLKLAILRWLNKENLDGGDALAAELVALAEARMRRDIIAQPDVVTLDFDIDDLTYPLPSGFDGLVSLTRTADDRTPITYLPPDQLDAQYRSEGGFGRRYTISNNMLYFDAAPGDVRMRYRSLFCPLSTSNRCNWILDNHLDAYLFGALVDSAAYFRDDPRTGLWQSKYEAAVEAINKQARRQQTNGPLKMRVPLCP